MSVSITTDIHCDRCSMWVHFACGRQSFAAAAVRAAVAAGWQRGVGSLLYCPDCNCTEKGYWRRVKCGNVLPRAPNPPMVQRAVDAGARMVPAKELLDASKPRAVCAGRHCAKGWRCDTYANCHAKGT